jgi:hypothetical protein
MMRELWYEASVYHATYTDNTGSDYDVHASDAPMYRDIANASTDFAFPLASVTSIERKSFEAVVICIYRIIIMLANMQPLRKTNTIVYSLNNHFLLVLGISMQLSIHCYTIVLNYISVF